MELFFLFDIQLVSFAFNLILGETLSWWCLHGISLEGEGVGGGGGGGGGGGKEWKVGSFFQ